MFQKSAHNDHLKSILVFISVIFVGFGIYSNVLQGEFVSDDYITIVENPAIRNLYNPSYIWEAFNTRFLVGLTFSINYWLDQLNVVGYHFFNIAIHIITSFLVYKFVLLTFYTPVLKDSSIKQNAFSIAYLASLIFLCHPVQTQSVSFIMQRATSLATFFYLLTLILYINARLQSKPIYFIAAFAAMILGMLSKEMTITLPITILAYEVFFLKVPGKIGWNTLKSVIPFFLTFVLLPLVLSQDRMSSIYGLKDKILAQSFSWNYFFTEINVLVTYLRLFLLPINQNHDYDYPLAGGLWEIPTLFSFCLLAIIIAYAVYVFSKRRLLSFGIMWFFITTSVEVLVVSFVHRGVIYEHWLYLPMVGCSIVLAWMLHAAMKNRFIFKVVSTVLLITFSILTYQRNVVWKNEIIFWHDVIKKSPNKASPYLAAGRAYARKGNESMAVQFYKKALVIDSNFSGALNNLGIIYARRGFYDLALKHFQRILFIEPNNGKAYNNLGYVHYLKNEFVQAIHYYQKSLRFQTDFPDTYFYMGQCYLKLGDWVEAENHFKKALYVYEKQSAHEKVEETNLILERLLSSKN